ncbi:hypothetical protein Mesau_00676 [Mesorhizobium australicum WSM2073]|uniref:Uncharacterized protein n=1 Tax=Mesorhizobium australicum (strain HAMBI 3006 / LMG 24608 / WSM2073) TaxID=754035 RepID=L0KFJ3_MESAW|nr:hypothetical protein Mesau_00676 [Mesorhizobium australicum WSM2073]
MSIDTEVLGKAAETLTNEMPKRRKAHLGRFLYSIAEAYASATWKAYGAAVGLGTNSPGGQPGDDVGKY